ncbi:MAG: hypothetical protein U1E36_07005 [Rickettsiales bacterium]
MSNTKIFKADLSLKKKLAPNGNAKELFPDEVIKECQSLIEDFKSKFFDEAASAFSYVDGSLRSQTMQLEDAMQQITALKGRSESLGFTLIARLLQSLQDYLDATKPKETHTNVVVKKHLESLMVALHKQITDDGGAIGRDLISSIDVLKKKVAVSAS